MGASGKLDARPLLSCTKITWLSIILPAFATRIRDPSILAKPSCTPQMRKQVNMAQDMLQNTRLLLSRPEALEDAMRGELSVPCRLLCFCTAGQSSFLQLN